MIFSSVFVFPEPAAPGALTARQFPGPDVILQFHRSEGHVDQYTATIESIQQQNINASTDNSIQSVTFSGLTLGAYYNVSIVATINPNQPSIAISSDTVVHEFRVKANSEFE